jgi:hypothetical protein
MTMMRIYSVRRSNHGMNRVKLLLLRMVCWVKGHRVKQVNVPMYSGYFCLCRRCYIPLHVARMTDHYYYHVDRGKCTSMEDFRQFLK